MASSPIANGRETFDHPAEVFLRNCIAIFERAGISI
jgi:hypothetical protein